MRRTVTSIRKRTQIELTSCWNCVLNKRFHRQMVKVTLQRRQRPLDGCLLYCQVTSVIMLSSWSYVVQLTMQNVPMYSVPETVCIEL